MIVLDEIHVLKNPSIVLKIAANHFPEHKRYSYRIIYPGRSKKI